MTCLELAEFLDEYLEGRLRAEAHAVFYQHLSLCPTCVAYVRSYREATRLGREALQSGGASDMPEELVAAILAARESRP